MNRSLCILFPFFPFPALGCSVHVSRQFSSTILQCLSNARILANSFRFDRSDIRIWFPFLSARYSTESGVVAWSDSSSTGAAVLL